MYILLLIMPVLQNFVDVKKKRKFYERLLAHVETSGFTNPTPIQRQVIPLLLCHREVLAVAPTGESADSSCTHDQEHLCHAVPSAARSGKASQLCELRLCVKPQVLGRRWRTCYRLSSTPKWPP